MSSEFLKSTMILTGGTILAQAIPMLFYPILTRLFKPEDFGLLASLAAITTILSTFATGKYETVILIQKSKKAAAYIFSLSIVIAFVVCFIIFLFFLFFKNSFLQLIRQEELGNWVLVVPIVAFSIVIFQCYNEWCVKNSYFKKLSLNKMTNTATVSLNNILIGLVKPFTGGMILGDTVGRIMTASVCIFNIFKRDRVFFNGLKKKILIKFLKRYKDCPKYILPGQMLNVVGVQLPIFFIGAYFSSSEVGFFSLTMSLLIAPALVISVAVRDTFRQRAQIIFKETGNCRTFYRKNLILLTTVSVVGFGILAVILPPLVSFVLGEEWIMVGNYGRIMCPMILIYFISEPFTSIFIISEKFRFTLFWQILFCGLTLLSLIIGCLFIKTIEGTLVCLTIGRSIVFLISLFYSYKYAKNSRLS